MVYIYIIALEQGKYYVGKTNDVDYRLRNHGNGNGSAWTKKYKPIEVIELVPDCNDFDEDKYTLMYMDKYGIDNVRGGSYVTIRLNTETHKQLEKILCSTKNKCLRCGKDGHYIKNCPDKKIKNKIICKRCGRDHNADDCYATTHKNGDKLTSKPNIIKVKNNQTPKKPEVIPTKNNQTPKQPDISVKIEKEPEVIPTKNDQTPIEPEIIKVIEKSIEQNECSRCGRLGHVRVICFETVDIKGNNIESTCIIC